MKYFYTFLTIALSLPTFVFAQVTYDVTYDNALVSIPGYDSSSGSAGLNDFVNIIYGLAISLAALLAVVKIVIAGLKWMLSDIVTDKADAKKDIQGALIGLIIIISAVLIIYTINPTIIGQTDGSFEAGGS